MLAAGLCLIDAKAQAASVAADGLLFRWQQQKMSCPGALEVERRIHDLAGAAHEQARARELVVWATAQRRSDGRWFIRLTPNQPGPDFKRVLLGQSCREVAEAAALVVAFMLGPVEAEPDLSALAVSDPPSRAATPPASETPIAAPAPANDPPTPEPAPASLVVRDQVLPTAEPPAAAVAPSESPASRTATRVSLALGAEQGMVPGLVTGPALGLDFSWGGVGLEVFGTLGFPAPAVGDDHARETGLTTFSTRAGACGELWRGGDLHQRACLGFAGNVVRAREKSGADQDAAVVATMWGPYAGTTLAFRCIGALETFLRVGVMVPVARPRIALFDFQGPPIRIHAAAGLAAQF